jgi:hypothetical protein
MVVSLRRTTKFQMELPLQMELLGHPQAGKKEKEEQKSIEVGMENGGKSRGRVPELHRSFIV